MSFNKIRFLLDVTISALGDSGHVWMIKKENERLVVSSLFASGKKSCLSFFYDLSSLSCRQGAISFGFCLDHIIIPQTSL